MTTIIEKLETEIQKEPDQYLDPIYRTHWRTSNFGRCYRLQYWYRKGVEVTNPIDLKVLRIFRVGNLFHRDLQALLPAEEVEVEFTVEDVHGHADWVGATFVEDFKTVGTFPWKLMEKPGFDVVKEKSAYISQLMAYCYFFKKPLGILTFVHKDSYAMKSFEFRLDDHLEKVIDELTVLRLYWGKQSLPPARPRAYNFKGCSYCPFQGRCDKEEGNTAKDRAILAKPKKASALF